jgi:hypothetical protein
VVRGCAPRCLADPVAAVSIGNAAFATGLVIAPTGEVFIAESTTGRIRVHSERSSRQKLAASSTSNRTPTGRDNRLYTRRLITTGG